MRSRSMRPQKPWGTLLLATLWVARCSWAVEVGQGTFETTLGQDFHCADGGGSFTSAFRFDDQTVSVPVDGENGGQLDVNFSVLGTFDATGAIDCVPDKGGIFHEVALNDARDFEWLEVSGEYLDPNPGIVAGDPFPFVGRAICVTTRTDAFKTLCEKFQFSFNGLSQAQGPDDQGFYRSYAGDFTMRAAQHGRAEADSGPVAVESFVDAAGGDLPSVEVTFKKGVDAPGDIAVTTLAAAYGTLPVGLEVPIRGQTTIDHGAGAQPFFPGGDERYIEVTTDAAVPPGSIMEVCLPSPRVNGPSGVRPVRVLHGEGAEPFGRRFVDRTWRSDPTTRRTCARVRSLAKFTVATADVCGGGQQRSDGLLTVAAGLIGRRSIVVDGLSDCTQYPSNLPAGLRAYCVPDGDAVPGQCTVSVTLGVNRAGCNRVPPGVTDPHSPSVQVGSYRGELRRGGSVTDLGALIGPQIAALSSPRDDIVGPVDLTLPVSNNKKITTYKLRQQLTGTRPGGDGVDTDTDVLTIQCLNAARY